MIIITEICLMSPKYRVVNLAGKILCYAPKPTYKSIRNQLSSVVNFRNRNTADFAIRIIDKENNEISVVFKELKGFEHIPDDDLFSNSLSLEPQKFIGAVPPNIGYLVQLTYLHINCLGLTKLTCNIGKLINLRYLDISNNKLTDLPMSMKKLKKLSTLNLTHNHFPVVPRVVMKIVSLNALIIHKPIEYRTWRYLDSIEVLKYKIPNLKILSY